MERGILMNNKFIQRLASLILVSLDLLILSLGMAITHCAQIMNGMSDQLEFPTYKYLPSECYILFVVVLVIAGILWKGLFMEEKIQKLVADFLEDKNKKS